MTTDAQTQVGYLVLADISGYTSYVAATELEHAQQVLTELLELLVGQLKPVLTLCKLEGDAVFAYLPVDQLPRGETLLEIVEGTYVSFRDRVEGIRRLTTCDCRACRAIPSLDLKFILHFGEFVVQRVSGIHELVGSDVNLIHRLAKNQVAEATGWRGYVLLTEQCLAAIAMAPDGLYPQQESYEHLGEVLTYSMDLHPRYAALTDARRVMVMPRDAHANFSRDIPAPPHVVWEWLNDPPRRAEWMPGTTWKALELPGGRTGIGARNHCAHGSGEVMLENVLDWRPFDYFTVESWMSGNSKIVGMTTHRLEKVTGGTRLQTAVKFRLPLPAWAARLAAKLLIRLAGLDASLALMARLIAEEQAKASEPAESLEVKVAV
jgi:uncharacterized protein YndB with AHSA1/START domain/class 3 adenylate cyclase